MNYLTAKDFSWGFAVLGCSDLWFFGVMELRLRQVGVVSFVTKILIIIIIHFW